MEQIVYDGVGADKRRRERMTPMTERAPASQTLSRGIRILEILADAYGPLTIDEVARQLAVHRSVAYRLVRTLEDHGLLTRSSGAIALAPRMAALAAGVAPDLQAAARPQLSAVADELGMTCLLAVLDRDETITLASAPPSLAVASVAQRPGARHRADAGAPSKAILSTLHEDAWPVPTSDRLRADVAAVRANGFATSHDEVIPTVRSVAVPLRVPGPPAALAVLHVLPESDPTVLAERLHRAAAAISAAFGS